MLSLLSERFYQMVGLFAFVVYQNPMFQRILSILRFSKPCFEHIRKDYGRSFWFAFPEQKHVHVLEARLAWYRRRRRDHNIRHLVEVELCVKHYSV